MFMTLGEQNFSALNATKRGGFTTVQNTETLRFHQKCGGEEEGGCVCGLKTSIINKLTSQGRSSPETLDSLSKNKSPLEGL